MVPHVIGLYIHQFVLIVMIVLYNDDSYLHVRIKILQHIYVRTYKYRIRLLLDWSNYQESTLENEYELIKGPFKDTPIIKNHMKFSISFYKWYIKCIKWHRNQIRVIYYITWWKWTRDICLIPGNISASMMLLLEMEGLARTADNSGNAVIVVCPLCGCLDGVQLVPSGETIFSPINLNTSRRIKLKNLKVYGN